MRPATIRETIRYACEIEPDTIQVSLAAPYPGTELYRQAQEQGWLPRESGSLVNRDGLQVAALQYPGLAQSEIFDSVEAFYRRFYFRPRKIVAMMGGIVVATVLTLVFLPALYATWFRVRAPHEADAVRMAVKGVPVPVR